MINFCYYCSQVLKPNISNSNTSIVSKAWFPWLLLLVLLVSNFLSFQFTNEFFEKNSVNTEEVIVEQDVINSSSRIINWARDILRFFRNPQ